MFPYTVDENAWLSKNNKAKVISGKINIFPTLIIAFFAALLSATIPSIIYFAKLNLL